MSAHRALAEAGEQRQACLEDWRQACERHARAMPLLLALTRLTLELSRPATREPGVDGVPAATQFNEATKRVRLE